MFMSNHAPRNRADDYLGLSVQAAEARAAQQDKVLRAVRPGDGLRLDFRPDRITAFLDDSGKVARAIAG